MKAKGNRQKAKGKSEAHGSFTFAFHLFTVRLIQARGIKILRLHSFRHQFVLLSLLLLVAGAALALPFVSASCRAPQGRASDAGAVERLRAMTRNDVLPAESVVAALATEQADTTAGALARIVQARSKMAKNDFAGAASLLDDKTIRRHTALADYALLLRADALAKGGRRVEARAAYEQLAREFPSSLRARDAILSGAEIALQDNAAAAVPLLVKKLTDADDATALLLTAKTYERQGDPARARDAYRRIYFYASASDEAAEARLKLTNSNASVAPANANEAVARADKLFVAKRYSESVVAYNEAATLLPHASPEINLRRGISAFNAKRYAESIAAFNTVPASAGELRAQSLFHLAQAHARAGQWPQARGMFEELRRQFPDHALTKRAGGAIGLLAKEAKNTVEATNFFRAAVGAYPGAVEVTQAQFELAWAAHEAKNYQESAPLLTEHLAVYADRNTDNRGRAGYWAARDSERAGMIKEATALYQAMLQRYDANWYGYLSQQRLEAIKRTHGTPARSDFAPDSPINRARANLSTVSIAAETAVPEADERLAKADQLNIVGLDEWAIEEVGEPLKAAPSSPRLNLAKARIHRTRDDNLQAFLALQKSYPDYAQMKPEELSREEWDVFYPLAHWETIKGEARARNIDPYRIAGLIRQESVFDPRAVSSARAYGLMQLLVETAQRTARKYGVEEAVNANTLLEPRLNIKLGTAYLKDQLDRFGRIEYVAAAYNAGPGRAVRWRTELPAEIDEWAEAVPFRETRGYVQGVVRNTLQYQRLYDEGGRFRENVGASRPAQPATAPQANSQTTPSPDNRLRPRRVTPEENEEK